MPAQQALMVSIITEGTNLGSENAISSDFGPTTASASASITFQTNGAVTFSQTGGSRSNTAPATNWNTNGGTYISYQITESFKTGSVQNGPAESTIHGENRKEMTTSMTIQAIGSDMLNEPTGTESGIMSIKLSVWDAASGGSRKAYGEYYVSADASVN